MLSRVALAFDEVAADAAINGSYVLTTDLCIVGRSQHIRKVGAEGGGVQREALAGVRCLKRAKGSFEGQLSSSAVVPWTIVWASRHSTRPRITSGATVTRQVSTSQGAMLLK